MSCYPEAIVDDMKMEDKDTFQSKILHETKTSQLKIDRTFTLLTLYYIIHIIQI